MLPKRGRPPQGARVRLSSFRKLYWRADDPNRPARREFAVDKRPSACELGIRGDFLERPDRSAWHSLLDEDPDHLVAGAAAGPFSDNRIQLVGDSQPRGVGGAPRIRDKLLVAHQPGQRAPMGFRQAEDQDLAIGGRIDVGRTCSPMAVSEALEFEPL